MGILLIFVAIGMFCVLLFNFAVYAVPAFVGLSAFFWAISAGAGIGSIVVGLLAGVAVFLLAQFALASQRVWLRWLVIAVFVIPAAYTGYSMVLELSGLGIIPSPIWRQIVAFLAGIAVAMSAFARLAAPMHVAPSSQT